MRARKEQFRCRASRRGSGKECLRSNELGHIGPRASEAVIDFTDSWSTLLRNLLREEDCKPEEPRKSVSTRFYASRLVLVVHTGCTPLVIHEALQECRVFNRHGELIPVFFDKDFVPTQRDFPLHVTFRKDVRRAGNKPGYTGQ